MQKTCAFVHGIGIFPDMKAILLTFSLLIVFSTASSALDIVTPEATFKDAKVTKVEAEGVRISHSEGSALVDFDLLPPAMQAEYGWTPEKSAARKAAKVAEEKRIADEEKMLDEAPKRKAMEEAAKKQAEEDKLLAEERAKRKIENAGFEAEAAKTQEEQLAEAAKARAELDRDRKGGKAKADDVPLATILGDSVTEVTEAPGPRRNLVTPPFGSVSDVISTGNPFFQNPKVWIGLGIGLFVVLILFMLPSGTPKKVRRR